MAPCSKLFIIGRLCTLQLATQDKIAGNPWTHRSTFIPVILGSDKTTVSVCQRRDFPPTTTQPNVGSRKEIPEGEGREQEEKLPASRTLRAGLCHSGTLASACVLRPSSKSSCPEFT